MYIDGVVLSLIGRLLGGHGRPRRVRLVFAWANAPRLIDLTLWILLVIFMGVDLLSVGFQPAALRRLTAADGVLLALAAGLILWVSLLWVFGLAAAHRFSPWTALLTLLLARMLVGALTVTFLLVLPVALFWGAAL